MSPRSSGVHAWGGGSLPTLLAVVVLAAVAGCATGAPRGSLLPGFRHHALVPVSIPRTEQPRLTADSVWALVPDASSISDEDDDPEDDVDEEASVPGVVTDAPKGESHSRAYRPEAGGNDQLDDWDEGGVGWPDGVGDGRPRTVPMSLDYFQGFLAHVGVPADALPVDGRALSPEQALRLLPHLLNTEGTLGDFAQLRMAAHLLLEVATGGGLCRARNCTREWIASTGC